MCSPHMLLSERLKQWLFFGEMALIACSNPRTDNHLLLLHIPGVSIHMYTRYTLQSPYAESKVRL